MLDQNTDRMWFVIGAVIVGAAIIFIANGTMPTLFASVADTFKDASAEATNVVSEMSPNTEIHMQSNDDMVNYFDVNLLKEGIDAEVSARAPGKWNHGSQIYDSYMLALELKPNTQYRLSSNVPRTTVTTNQSLYFNNWSNSDAAYAGHDVVMTSDGDGFIFVGMPKGREGTAGILDGTYWVRLEEVIE